MNKKSIIIIAALLILTAGGAALYYALEYRLAHLYYFEVEGKSLKGYIDTYKNNYNKFYEENIPYLSGRHSSEIEIRTLMNADAMPENIKNTVSLLNNVKIGISTKNDAEGNKAKSDLSLYMADTPLVDVRALKDEQRIWLSVPVIMPETWLNINKDRLEHIYSLISQRYGIRFIEPLKLFNSSGLLKSIYYSEPEINDLAGELGEFLKAFLTNDTKQTAQSKESEGKSSQTINGEEYIKYGEISSLQVDDKNIKVKEIIVKLSGEKFKSLLKQLTDTALEDEKFMKLVYGNLSSVVKYLDETGILQIANFIGADSYYSQSLEIMSNPESFKGLLYNFVSACTFPEEVTMSVLIDKKGNIVDRKITLPFVFGSEPKKVIRLHSGTYNTSNNICDSFVDVKIDADEPWAFEISTKKVGEDAPTQKVSTFNFMCEDNSMNISLRLGFDDKLDNLTLMEIKNINYDIEITDKSTEVHNKINGVLRLEQTENEKFKTQDKSITLEADFCMPSFNFEAFGFMLNVNKRNIFEIEEVAVTDLLGKETIDLNEFSMQDMESLENRVLMSFGMFYLKNKQIIDSLMSLPGK